MADPQPKLPKGYEGYTLKVNPDPILPKGFESYTQKLDPLGGLPQGPEAGNQNPSPDLAPFLGKLATESLPAAGAFVPGPGWAAALGIGAGTILKNVLKQQHPEMLGTSTFSSENPISDTLKDIGEEELFQRYLPQGVGKLAEGGVFLAKGGLSKLISGSSLRNLPAVRDAAVKQMTDQLMGGYKLETPILEEAAAKAGQRADAMSGKSIYSSGPLNINNTLENTFGTQAATSVQPNYKSWSKSFKAIATKQPEPTVENKIGDLLLNLDKETKAGADTVNSGFLPQVGPEIAKSQTYKQISSLALSDVSHVRNAKLATGDSQFTTDLALNKLLGSGDETLKASSILKELSGPKNEIYSEAIHPDTMSSFRDALEEIRGQQEGHETSDRILSVSRGHLLWSVPAAIGGIFGGGGLGHIVGGVGAAATGEVITNSLLKRYLANPQTAAAVVQALRTPASSPMAPFLRKVIEGSAKFGGAALEAQQ